jgi:hypothetical protein
MVQVQQRVLGLSIALLAAIAPAVAQKFYADDPLLREPKPLPVVKPLSRPINEYYDFFQDTFFEPDKRLKKHHTPGPSQAVNTLGEVPDSAWYTNRNLTVDQMVEGPGATHAPAIDKPWTVISGKNEGITPGLVIRDSAGRKYFVKFDPLSNPEMASATDVLGSKFFYALGYNVPENYIVRFTRQQLALDPAKSTFRNPAGRDRPMTEGDIEMVLEKAPRDRQGRYRALASLAVEGAPIGPFRYYGTRKDDPNDVVPHQMRRDLRGLYVFAAWLNHTDSKSINSLDTVVEEAGLKYIRHYLIDFGAILGSDSFEAKSPRAGNVFLYDFKPAAWQFLSLGFYVPAWMRAHYPDLPEAGHLEYKTFDPENWKNNYPNPAFDLRTPGDTYWAAKKVMQFSDDAIRAIVNTAQYSDERAAEWVARCIIERRNKVGRAFLNDVLPLDHFAVGDGKLTFEDLAVHYGFHDPRRYTVAWSAFDNATSQKSPIAGAVTFDVPRSNGSAYLAADIRAEDPRKTVTVYLRGSDVIGIDRAW